MSTTQKARIYGASDDLIEFDGAIDGEAGWYSEHAAKITLKAPDGTKMRLTAQFCGNDNRDGWWVGVVDNPGGWMVESYVSRTDPDDGSDLGVVVTVPVGTKAKCNGRAVR